MFFKKSVLQFKDRLLSILIGFRLARAAYSTSQSTLPSEADVVIIGGGSLGASTLYHLTQRGVKAVWFGRVLYLSSWFLLWSYLRLMFCLTHLHDPRRLVLWGVLCRVCRLYSNRSWHLFIFVCLPYTPKSSTYTYITYTTYITYICTLHIDT